MSPILNVISLNLKTFMRQKIRILALFLFISLLGTVAGLAGNLLLTSTNIADTIPLAIVDLDDSFESRMLLSGITETVGSSMLELSILDKHSAADALENGIVSAVVTMPENFGASIISGENMPFIVAYNRNTPLVSALVRIAADSFADMLRSSQTGVYVTLNYALAQDIPQEQYNSILMNINMMFIGLVMNRAEMFTEETVSVAGLLSIWQVYFITAYIALMMCASFVMTDTTQRNFGHYAMVNLSLRGISSGKVFLACAISYWLLLLALNAGVFLCAAALSAFLGLPAISVNAWFVPGIAAVAAVLAAFAAMLAFAFNSTLSAGIFTAVFVGISLFLSGGVIPLEFLSSGIQFLSHFVFNTWGVRLLAAVITGENSVLPLVMCVLFGSFFAAIGCIAANSRGRAAR
ncbi:MAG: ABC transporter permease [Defluviitaleaceae bacterium]|nr:ABC transporter permease [Defluviitaleaceae bacterium]